MNWTDLSDKGIVEEIAKRVKQKRLNLNLTQLQLAQKAGLHIQTIKNFERGDTATLQTFIQILRVLDELDFFDKFIPDHGQSPIELLKLKGRKRTRASSK
jgi:putative transcriptional regulator